MSKIKICGLRREQDVDFVNELKPDYAGFILSAGFRRSIDMQTAAGLKAKLDKSITAVGVFVNENADVMNSFISQGIIDMAQLHGSESARLCSQINAPVIKYFKCGSETAEEIKEYEQYVDYFLFDSGTGTGKAFDWRTIPKTDKPFFLAGGLGADNLERSIREVKPFAVDLSSSVETDGFKDYDKIKKVIEITRRAENE